MSTLAEKIQKRMDELDMKQADFGSENGDDYGEYRLYREREDARPTVKQRCIYCACIRRYVR